MINIKEIQKPFQQLIHIATGMPLNRILAANQARPGIKDPYCVYNIQPSGIIGAPRRKSNLVAATDCSVPNWHDDNEEIKQRVMLKVSCNFYRNPASDYAWMIPRCNYRNSIAEHLLRNEMQWSGTTTPNNLTSLSQGEYDERYQVDVNLVVEGKIKELVLNAYAIGWDVRDTENNVLSKGESFDKIEPTN